MASLHRSFLGALLATCVLFAGVPAGADDSVERARPTIRRPFRAGQTDRLPSHFRIAGQTYLNRGEYEDLRNGCMELLRRYRPDRYFFVGLGRDPAPVIAFLQNLGGRRVAVNLPGTSNIGWRGNVRPADVARHIEAAIPAEVLRGNRQIVILDVTSSGKTPAVFGPYLDRYLAAHGHPMKSVKLAFSWINVMEGSYGNQLTDWIDTTEWKDFANYFGGKYEGHWEPENGGSGIGEHQRHQMGRGVKPPRRRNPNYKAFRVALQRRMAQDEMLDTFLATLSPGRNRSGRAARPWLARLTHRSTSTAAVPRGALFSLRDPRPSSKEGAEDSQQGGERGSFDYLSQSDYTQLRRGALGILEHAPPREAFYVGVGRSSGPLVAYLEHLGRDVATYLPADGVHHLADASRVRPAAQRALDALFDAFIPREALRGTRKIVLFQRSSSGSSLPYLKQALRSYLERQGSPTQVDIVALGEHYPEQGGFVDIQNSEELRALNERKYQIVAPYRYFRPGRTELETVVDARGQPLGRSREYSRFKNALARRMANDSVLATAMRSMQSRPASRTARGR